MYPQVILERDWNADSSNIQAMSKVPGAEGEHTSTATAGVEQDKTTGKA